MNADFDDALAQERARAMGMALYYVYLLRKGSHLAFEMHAWMVGEGILP